MQECPFRCGQAAAMHVIVCMLAVHGLAALSFQTEPDSTGCCAEHGTGEGS